MSVRFRGLIPAAVAALSVALTVLVVVSTPPGEAVRQETTEAPPDLAQLRGAFQYGLQALRRGAGANAMRYLGSFTFGRRAVEQYRLYFYANAAEVAGKTDAARMTLARLWSRKPQFVYWQDAAFNLAGLYASRGDWRNAGSIYSGIAARTEESVVAGTARWHSLLTSFAAGDLAGVYRDAREVTVKNPRTPQSAAGIAIVRSLSALGPANALPLTDGERLERAVSLMRDGDSQNALNELNSLEASGVVPSLRVPVQLNRGLALYRLHRYVDSNALLEPLTSGPFRFAIPAIYHAWKNYSALATSIDPTVTKTITVKKRVGTVRVYVKVKGKRKLVTRPRYANVKKSEKLVDLAKKKKKEEYERLAVERLRDLLSLPIADPVRIEVLNALISIAEEKKENDTERALITDLSRLDPSQEAGLQHFWDEGWAAYTSGDLHQAEDLFDFVHHTYRNPNVKRQAAYWRARSIERLGRKEEAEAVYRTLANAQYDDLYAIFSEERVKIANDPDTNPLKVTAPDWQEIAEASMPDELRLAYELTALDDGRDARLEIQKNLDRSNQMYADALLADLYHSTGDTQLMMRSLRRAFPRLATVEQDAVPKYFLSMYYPMRYQPLILEYAQRNHLDPDLVMALIHQESYFVATARSAVGASGLMQMMPPTAKELAGRLHSSANVETPEVALRLGTFYFRELVDLFNGSVPLAIAAYNAGRGNVSKWRNAAPRQPMDEFLESIPFAETRNYVKRVTLISSTYRRMRL